MQIVLRLANPFCQSFRWSLFLYVFFQRIGKGHQYKSPIHQHWGVCSFKKYLLHIFNTRLLNWGLQETLNKKKLFCHFKIWSKLEIVRITETVIIMLSSHVISLLGIHKFSAVRLITAWRLAAATYFTPQQKEND